MINFNALPAATKRELKPLVAELRKNLYTRKNLEKFQDGGIVVNFGKGTEKRHTLKIEVVG